MKKNISVFKWIWQRSDRRFTFAVAYAMFIFESFLCNVKKKRKSVRCKK